VIIRIFDELRDPWAIALAQVTAFISFLVGAPAWQIVTATGAVLGARVIAGFALPLGRPTVLPPSILTDAERRIVRLIADGLSPALIAEKRRLSLAAVENTYRSILSKLEMRHPWEVRAWAITVGLVNYPPRPGLLRRIVDSTPVRATLTAGGLIGLLWTVYQIWRAGCPTLRLAWPWLPECP
jgi:DNA-binding CsgD family transcriptional regulator